MSDLLRQRCLRSERAFLAAEPGMLELLRAEQAKCDSYLRSHSWCARVDEMIAAYSVPGVVSIFLVTIEPRENADARLWVIVGDMPSAYLVLDELETPDDVLGTYAALMDDCAIAVRSESVSGDVFPVAAEPSLANAEALESRMQYLRSNILPLAIAHWSESVTSAGEG